MREALKNSKWPDLQVVPTGFAVHITEEGLNKSSGLKVAFEQRGIDPKKVIAVGTHQMIFQCLNYVALL